MQNKPSKWVSGYKHGPAASYTQITRMGLFLNVSTSKFEPLDSTWDNLHSGGMFISGTNKIYFRDETNKDIYINSPADNQLEIYATGGITAPAQPAFLAYPASNQNNFAIDTEVTVILGTEVFDQGGNFASNTFTAPVTGKYQFDSFIYFIDMDTAADYYRLKLITSNRTYYYILDTNRFSADVGRWTIGFSILADMDASDTAYLSVYQSGGTAQTDISTNAYFSGFLAC